jgi:condensin complex subunit 1
MLIFEIVLMQCKKFVKAEVKACVEEFEEKISKIHEERKEQEVTAQNAKMHQQRLGTLGGFVIKKNKERKENSDTVADGTSLFYLFVISTYSIQ